MIKATTTIKSGLLIFAGLVVYFLLLRTLDLHTNPIYSIGNAFIVGAGIFLAYYTTSKASKGSDKLEYYSGFNLGFLTGLNATVLFLIFFVLFSEEIEPTYLQELVGNWKTHYHTPDALVFFVVFIMGISTSIVTTLFLMQYYKRSWNLKTPS